MRDQIASYGSGENGQILGRTVPNDGEWRLRISVPVDFINKGLVIIVVPNGNLVKMNTSPFANLAYSEEHASSPFPLDRNTTFHQRVPFQSASFSSDGKGVKDAEVYIMFPRGQLPKLEELNSDGSLADIYPVSSG